MFGAAVEAPDAARRTGAGLRVKSGQRAGQDSVPVKGGRVSCEVKDGMDAAGVRGWVLKEGATASARSAQERFVELHDLRRRLPEVAPPHPRRPDADPRDPRPAFAFAAVGEAGEVDRLHA